MSLQLTREQVLAKLNIDEHYYGQFGQQWLSSSNIGRILSGDPLSLFEKQEPKLAFVIGSYFHVAVLEPHKLDKFVISKASSRRSKDYKEQANGNILLLEKDVQRLQSLIDATLTDIEAYPYIRNSNVEYELPGYGIIEDLPFKGKADIINHDLKLVVDLKTTADIESFEDKITQWNYDSQAYIYEQLFGYDFAWIACCKRSERIKVVQNIDEYKESGRDKVERAAKIYKEWFDV